MNVGTGYLVKSLRLHPAEDRIIDSALAALRGLDRATFMTEAALIEATRLGILYGAPPPAPLVRPWPYVPERGDEPTSVRISITVSLAALELISRAAAYIQTSEPLFIIGSALANVGRLQSQFRALHADAPSDADRIRKRLAAIVLPPQYRHRHGAT